MTKNYIRKASKEKQKWKDYGAIDEEDHESEHKEEQSEKDMESFGVEIK